MPIPRSAIGQAAKDRLSALRCPTASRACGVLLMVQPCLKRSPLYQPRDPKASNLWRLIDEHLDSYQQVYDERFQAKYGWYSNKSRGMRKKAEVEASDEPLAEETTTSRSSQTWAMLIKRIPTKPTSPRS